jgi:Zn-dependent oligopeptidase
MALINYTTATCCRAFAAKQAAAGGDANATPENGPWVISLDMPSYLPAMQHLKNRELREQLYRAFCARGYEIFTLSFFWFSSELIFPSFI